MLTQVPSKRPSAAKLLSHKWFKKTTSQNIPLSSLKHLREFHATKNLQFAIMNFMASQLTGSQEVEQLQKEFNQIDENGDGKLSKQELFKVLKVIKGEFIAKAEVEEIFKKVDTDQSGFIDWHEFVVASMDKRMLLSQERLRKAFDLFDTDKSGSISKQELLHFFQGQLDENTVTNLIKEADKDGDGEIDITEFMTLLNALK